MKVAIFEDRNQMVKLHKMGRKTKSHGTFRAKRKPNSPRVRTQSKVTRYQGY